MNKFVKWGAISIGVLAILGNLGKHFSKDDTKNEQLNQTSNNEVIENNKDDDAFDSFANLRINGLVCNEKSFMTAQAFNTGYTDLKKTNFKNKTIFFRDDYCNTEFYAFKRTGQVIAKTFRDFPCIGKITVIIPCKSENKTYKTTMTFDEAQNIFDTDFKNLRSDIKIWRKDFLENPKYDKDFVYSFAKKYVKISSL